MTKYFVGIDTSSYTTSLAVLDQKDNIVLNIRDILKVKKGKRGLRQQEAVFQHIQNLPFLIEKMAQEIDTTKIVNISCSNRPRNREESYMPVFVVGKGQAFILSKVLNTGYKEFSHQEGHIGAGMINSNMEEKERFISLHISGGTTEMLLVKNKKNGFDIEIIGGTLDLSLGQLIDRVGVELGLIFPCGEEMDKVSQIGNNLKLDIHINIKDSCWFNLSGMENYFKALIQKSEHDLEDIIATLFYTISQFLKDIILNGCNMYNIHSVLITGGVAANSTIRNYLSKELCREGIDVFFPKKNLCTDNAVGIAYLGKTKSNLVGDKFGRKAFKGE